MKTRTFLVLAAVSTLTALTAFSQGGPSPAGNIHRSLSALEAELLSIIDQKEQILNATELRNTEINQITVERNRAQGPDRDRLNQRIEAQNNQNRIAAVETARLNLTSERIRIEIDRLMRFEEIIASGGKGGAKTPPIRTINVIKRDRKGPLQVPGQGRGFQETALYEVVFADGTRQRVEATTFIPQR